MKLVALVISSAGALVSLAVIPQHCQSRPTAPPDPVELALAGDERGVQALRALGPRGLEMILAAAPAGPAGERAIDRVSGQRYGHVSRLFWFTDLEAAQAEARRTQKPILSLRMLGDLREELSCANSRFFRTVLYPDPEVQKEMSAFVLHWSSERSVPVMTIEFADGRRLRRTITGNSIHYVLDAEGRVLDAIPGMWGPAQFAQRLSEAIRSSDETPKEAKPPKTAFVPAERAVGIAIGKSMVEAPLLGVQPSTLGTNYGKRERVSVSKEARALMRAQNRNLTQQRFAEMVSRFERTLEQDTRRNRTLDRRIARQLQQTPRPEMVAFNRWVYADVFGTPREDPWLGLHQETVFTGLEGAGVE